MIGYDIIKFIAMFLVVMLHYSFYTRYYSRGLAGTLITVLCVVCVPLFFSVNGALLLPRDMDEVKHYRKTLNIIIVVTIWKLLAATFFIFVDGSHPVTAKDLAIFLLGGGFGDYPTGYFWFMNALIAVYLVLPVMKLAFDTEHKIAFNALLVVLTVFTVGKDSLTFILQAVGTMTNRDYASLTSSLGEFCIFGPYGYVLLYVLVGGVIGRHLKRTQAKHSDDALHLLSAISPAKACIGIALCYVLTLLIQRYQHAAHGTNLTVENGYLLLPTFIATILIVLTVGQVNVQGIWSRIFQVIGMNTFGIYMLHLMGLILLNKLQSLPRFQFTGNMNSVAMTLLNILLCTCVFAACLAVSASLRKIPYIGRLFTL